MLHHRCKNKRRDKRNRQRISYRLIMLIESIFEDIEAERLVKVLEENFSQVVTFTMMIAFSLLRLLSWQM